MYNNIALFIIQLLHIFLVIFLISSVFVPSCTVKKIAFILLIFLMIQYIFKFGKCGLTQLEYAVLGENYKQGFLYRLVNPVVCVPEHYFNYGFYIVHVLWIVILGYQLYKSNCLFNILDF
jgi:hypothetical protein